MDIEYVLEILSGAWSILLMCFLVFLCVYMLGQWRTNKLTWRNIFALPLGMVVAFALAVQTGGSFSSRATVWYWRRFHDGEPLSALSVKSLAISAFVASLGILLMIRAFSRPRYGELPWILSAALTISYVALSLVFKI